MDAKLQSRFLVHYETRAENQDLDKLLVTAIEQWMSIPPGQEWHYQHGNAQGIARALAVLRGTDFVTEWEKGLDGYQRKVVSGE